VVLFRDDEIVTLLIERQEIEFERGSGSVDR